MKENWKNVDLKESCPYFTPKMEVLKLLLFSFFLPLPTGNFSGQNPEKMRICELFFPLCPPKVFALTAQNPSYQN